MRRRPSTQMPMPFEPDRPAMRVPALIAQDLVQAVADLLLARADADDRDEEERDHAREDHR